MTDAQMRHMAERFLGWSLPEHFNPDGGVSFDAIFNKGTQYEGRHRPSGTNLLGFDDALEMVKHMADGMPAGDDVNIRLRVDASPLKEVIEAIRSDVLRQIQAQCRRGLERR